MIQEYFDISFIIYAALTMGANIFKMTNVPSSRYQKSDMTIGFCDIDLVGKSCWMSQKSSFFAIFSMTKIENWGHFGKM